MAKLIVALLLSASLAEAQLPFNSGQQNAVLSSATAPAWSPLDLGSALIAWYDASDVATITQSSGAVSAWNDKSGSGFHLLQSTSGNKPTYSATGFEGNSPGITFDGVNDYLAAASTTIGTSAVSCFALVQFNTGSNLNLVGYQANGDGGPFSSHSVILLENQAVVSLRSYWNGVQAAIVGPAATPPPASSYLTGTGYYRMATVFNGTTNTMYLDNSYATSAISYSGTLTTPGTLLVGARSGGGQPWSGPVSEIIMLNRAATSDERGKIDTFLLRKWSRVLVTEGDSITAISATVPRFPALFMPNANPPAYVEDLAISGTDFWTNANICLLDRVAATDAHLPADKRGRQYILFFTFANQVGGGYHGGTPPPIADYVAAIGTFCLARKAAGWDKVVIATTLDRTDTEITVKRNAYNALITAAGWKEANGVDAIADFAGDAIMGVDDSPTVNPSYWVDGVHPNAAGFARLEVIFRATINGL